MLQLLTTLEKKALVCSVLLMALIGILISIDMTMDEMAWIYVAIIVIVMLSFEIYIYVTYISDRSSNINKFAELSIRGVPNGSKTYMYLDGRLISRIRGEFTGAGIKLCAGNRNIGFSNGGTSISKDVGVRDGIDIYVDFVNNAAIMNVEYKEQKGTIEEIEERTRQSKKVNMFILIMINLLMLLAVMRVLASVDII